MSMAVDMEGGMASYVGAAGTGADAGAGNDAARAAAIDGAAIFFECARDGWWLEGRSLTKR